VQVQGVSVTAAQDLFEHTPADDKPVKVMGDELAQTSDFGDSAAEGLPIAIRRGNTTSGSGGSAPTVRSGDRNASAAGFTAEANNTTKATTSGATILNTGWNVQIPEHIWWPDNFGISASQADTTVCTELVSAPADALTVQQTQYTREW
jgi:hypothetical protein